MSQKRLPKYKRAKTPVPLRLQERDKEIIKLVWEYRFLQADHISLLLGSNRKSILRRLQKLYHNRYLQRIYFPIVLFQGGSEKPIYALDRKGAEILTEDLGIPPEKLDWTDEKNKVKERYLRHALMISNFRVILTCAIREVHPYFSLLFWMQGKELKDEVFFEENSPFGPVERRIAVVPDALFCLEDRRQGKEGKMYFFLEADRSTMTTKRFLWKMRGYWNYWKQGKVSQRYGFRNFRVLVLTKSPQRRDSLCQVTQKADDRQIGSYMFWFAAEEDIKLEDPLSIFQYIWRTPVLKDQRLHSILE